MTSLICVIIISSRIRQDAFLCPLSAARAPAISPPRSIDNPESIRHLNSAFRCIMPLKRKAPPTRVQPPRAAKNCPPPVKYEPFPKTTECSVTKKLTSRKIKSPTEGAVVPDPSSSDPGHGEVEETDTENPFAGVNGGKNNFLKHTDIIVGNIISTGHHESYTELRSQNDEYRSKYARESGDSCGHVHSKYRKFVIVARFKMHFVALPIYSNRLRGLEARDDRNEYAEILDYTLKKKALLPRPQPLCRGSTDNIWLWSEAYPIVERAWARMADTSVAWMSRPVVHANNIRAKVVSRLDKESEEQLLRWARDCLVGELEVGVREHLRVLGKEGLKDADIPEQGPWGKQEVLI
ncbi:hypothetical protein V494_05942 [Pseudogymnoascus sp. VKM F-4513 (FW-928)]|nr:hypothetical protein V494_05942 [Pseudogymnoascus sp. VKM F-4513 (FW-928)]